MIHILASNYSRLLLCEFTSWTVLEPGVLCLDLPFGNTCDMFGAIAIALMIMDGVHTIEVWEADQFQVRYVRSRGRDWTAEVVHGEN